jgi:hypothetical protein
VRTGRERRHGCRRAARRRVREYRAGRRAACTTL